MAENKKSFILYCDLLKVIEKLPDETAGKLFKLVLMYVNDLDICIDDLLLEIAFEPIKNQLKRDLKKFEEVKDRKSISGKEGNLKRWNLDLYKEYKKGKYTLSEAENIASNRKQSHTDSTQSQTIANIAVNDTVNVNENVNDSDNVNVNVINKNKESKRKTFTPPSQDDVYDYFLEKGLDFSIAKNESEKFVDFYGSKGWLVGRSKMKNWKFAGNNWIKRWKEYNQNKEAKTETASSRLLNSVKNDILSGDLSYYQNKDEFLK